MLKISGPWSGRTQKGFSIWELMIVISLIMIISTIGGIYITNYIRTSRLQEAARNLDGDLEVIRNAARVRQERNIVVVFTTGAGVQNGLIAFLDANGNLIHDAGAPDNEQIILSRQLPTDVQLAVTSTSPGAVAPFTTVQFTALGTVQSDTNRQITITMASEPIRRFQIQLAPTGVTRVMRSEDAGATWPTRAW
jgi:Tfp pilus assembly protein FimT